MSTNEFEKWYKKQNIEYYNITSCYLCKTTENTARQAWNASREAILSRKCEDCKHFKEHIDMQAPEQYYDCDLFGIYLGNDFCCNRWKAKLAE